MSQEYSFITSGLRIKQDNLKNLAKDLKCENLDGAVDSLIKIFSQKKNELPQSMSNLCSFISESANGLSKDELSNLANKAIEELASYFEDWCVFCEQCSNLQVNYGFGVFVLNGFMVADVEEIFKHCKESSRIYERCFLEVAVSLSNLFKLTYQCLKYILEMFEKCSLDQFAEEGVSKFAEGVSLLLRLTLVLKDIDIMPLVNTMRSINRIVFGKRDWMHDKIDCVLMFTTLCTCIIEKLDFCWLVIQECALQNQANSKKSSKIIKVLRFLVSMLLQLIKEYKNEIYGDSTSSIIETLLSLQWFAPMSLHKNVRGTPAYDEFCSAVLSVMEPLLSELLQERDFVTRFLSIYERLHDSVDGRRVLSALLVSTSVASLLVKAGDDMRSSWMNEVSISGKPSHVVDLIILLFGESKKMNMETVCLPNFVEAGRPLREISLHEHCYIRTCALAATLCQEDFEQLESILLKHVLSPLHFSLFASDIMSFIARWGPESLCYQQTEFFANMLLAAFQASPTQSDLYDICSSIFGRLFLLLGDARKEDFIRKALSTKKDFLVILGELPFSRISFDLRKKYLGALISKTLDGLESYKTDGDEHIMLATVKLWERCLVEPQAFQLLSPLQRNGVITTLLEFFAEFKDQKCTEMDERLVCLILAGTSRTAPFLTIKQTVLALQVSLALAESNQSECLCVRLCQLLAALKMVDRGQEFQGACLPSVVKLFRVLLAHKSFFVQHEAMQTLVQFSEVASSTGILSHCIPETMVESFDSFSRKTKLLDEVPDEEKEKRLEEAVKILLTTEKKKAVDFQGHLVSPVPVQEPVPEELLMLEDELKSVVAEIKRFAEKGSIPDWMAQSFSTIAQELNDVRT